MSEITSNARHAISGGIFAVTTTGDAPSTLTTGDTLLGQGVAATPAQYSSISDRIKNGVTTPEGEVLSKHAEWAKSAGRRWSIPSRETQAASYERACEDRALSEANKQPFIYPGFSEAGDFWLSRGMTLVGACSGSSKSTTAANVLAGFIKYRSDTVAVVLSNEESPDAVIHRTACVLLGKSYMAFHKDEMQPRDADSVRETARKLLSRIIIVADQSWDTTCLEDVQTILNDCVPQNINLVLLDYYQTVCHSRLEPEAEHYRVLKHFGKFMREYGKNSPIPVVVFCQLSPKSHAPEFQSRVQHDKTIYNDAFNAVEIEPDFETKLTTFHIRKQRFGTSQGKKVVLRFDGGRYVNDSATESL